MPAGNASAQVAAPMADVNGVVDNTPDSLARARMARPRPGSTRRGDNPVLFLVGNSTMRTGTLGNGNSGQWGWGYYFPDYFDPTRISVENQALGGMSSRTFYKKLWPEIAEAIRPGDWVMIELGHNDNGPYDSGRARASIPGTGSDSLIVTIRETGVRDTVYTYGEYLRRYVRETRARGGHPVLLSLTPRNAWTGADSTTVARYEDTFTLWCRDVARRENVPFIDLNDITARKFERFGRRKTATMFYKDNIHSSEFGAMVNAASAAEGLAALNDVELSGYLLPAIQDTITGSTRKPGCPVVFTIGDSTVKNRDSGPDSKWGWGSVLHELTDTSRISVENYGAPGRSGRTFVAEGRWDKVYNALRPGDFVLIQFGHNDVDPIDSGRERGDIRGTGPESKVFRMASDGSYKVVYTYGWYLRKFIGDAREKGAIPVIVSPAPRDWWTDGRLVCDVTEVRDWAEQVAREEGVDFIDLYSISAAKLQPLGPDGTGHLFRDDHTHTSLEGARMNASSVAEGLRQSQSPLREYIRP